MQDSVTPTRRRGVRGLIWIALASILAMTLLGFSSAAVLGATTLLQDTPISSDDLDYQGDEEECEGAVGPGEVLWHFVLAGTDANSGTLTAEFDDEGIVVQFSSISPGKTIHWYVITGPDTLLSASTDQNGNRLVLSHICQGEQTTTTTQTTTQTTSGTITSGTTTAQ